MADKRSWSASPTKKTKPTIPGSTQSMLKEKADKLIDDVIKPTHVKLPPTRLCGSASRPNPEKY
jgi:hypothetical protein